MSKMALWVKQESRSEARDRRYLVIGKKAGFLGVFASLATATGRCMNTEIGDVRESERSAIGRHADDQFLFRGTQTDPHGGRVIHTKLFLPFGI